MAAAPQAASAPSFPAGNAANPYSASFYANQAALQFSEQQTLAEDQRNETQNNANYQYNLGVNTRAEPLKLTANRNTANSQGLAESGVLAKSQTQAQIDYSQKNSRLGEARKAAAEKIQLSEYGAKEGYNKALGSEIAKETERQNAEAINNPPQPIGATPANAGGVRTVLGTPKAGGVVPYEESSPRGFVRVGAPRPQPRVAAVKKALGVGAAGKALSKGLGVG